MQLGGYIYASSPLSAPCRKVLGSSLKTGSFVRLGSTFLRSTGGFPRRTPAACKCTGPARWRRAARGGRSAPVRSAGIFWQEKGSNPPLDLKPRTHQRAGFRRLTCLTTIVINEIWKDTSICSLRLRLTRLVEAFKVYHSILGVMKW